MRGLFVGLAFIGAVAAVARPGARQAIAPAAIEPAIAVWYRGSPVGVPRQDDLAALRALGFTHVAWPLRLSAGMPDLRRMAALVDLSVVVRVDPKPITAESARRPGLSVDLPISSIAPEQLPALAWRAIAHGARDVAIDAGEAAGAGTAGPGGGLAAWVKPALALSRQVSGNAVLIGLLREAAPVSMEQGSSAAVDVVLLESERAWVLVATNTGTTSTHVVSRLPAGVPSALWVSLIDGEAMSMLSLPGGPRWTVDLEPGAASVYVIDKRRPS